MLTYLIKRCKQALRTSRSGLIRHISLLLLLNNTTSRFSRQSTLIANSNSKITESYNNDLDVEDRSL